MKVLSLFSGIGGFDLGFERAGMVCDTVCEIDVKAQGILRRHFPNAKLYDDVRRIGKDTHDRGTIDLICGGFPCQDVSIAGKRKGLAGERSGLWFEFARVIDELEPRWVVIENVPGLLSSHGGKDFAVIVHWLAKRGYGTAWRILNSQYFGIPQRRRRVFIVASFGTGRAAEVLFESEGGAGDTETSGEPGKEIAYALRANPSHSGDKGDGGINTTLLAFDEAQITSKEHGSVPSDVSQPLNTLGRMSVFGPVLSQEAKKSNSPENNYVVAGTLTGQSYKGLGGGKTARSTPTLIAFDANQNLRDVCYDISPPLLHNGDGKSAHGAYPKISIMATGQAGAEIVNDGEPSLTANHEAPILWEMSHADEAVRENGKISPTLQARMGTGGNQVPMVGVRRLMPVECERLQGFPDNWTDGQSDSARYKQLGNAVSIPPAYWIGKRIMEVEKRYA